MKKYLYISYLIVISFFVLGCFDERCISSSNNYTEDSGAVSKNTDIKEIESNKIIDNSTNFNFINNSSSSIHRSKSYNLDNKSFINSSKLNSNLNDNVTDLNISDTSLINSSLVGTYKIIFFGSQIVNVDNAVFGSIVDMYYISNDCKNAKKLYPDIVNNGLKNKCSILTQSKILDGQVIIFYDESNHINIVSRLQMEDGIIENSPVDKYQYTVYSPIKDSVILKGNGVINWNYNILTKTPSNISNTFNTSPFKLSILDNGLIRIDMTLIDKKIHAVGKNITINAINTIILEKISSDYTRLENKVKKKFSR